jgi:hypothetical protein
VIFFNPSLHRITQKNQSITHVHVRDAVWIGSDMPDKTALILESEREGLTVFFGVGVLSAAERALYSTKTAKRAFPQVL